MKLITGRADGVLLAALVLALILMKAALTALAGLELHFDEAQYWTWAQQLDWSYYSKGPLIAWLIALSTSLLGDGEWQVRLPGWLLHGAFLIFVFHFAKDVWNSRAAAWWAVCIAATTPLYFTLSLVMTTDNLVLLFWTWGLWAMVRALNLNHAPAWYGAGAAIGLGALTKLSIGLLPAFVGIALLFKREWRRQLVNPHLWGGLVLMAVCMAPVLYWNALHDWVMLRHEVGHVSGDEAGRPLEFVASQILALSPLMVLLGVMTLRRIPPTSTQRLLWGLSLAWFGFFLFKSLESKVQANWAAPCYIGAIILLAGHMPTLSPRKKVLLYAGLASSVLLSMIMLFPQMIGLTEKEFAPVSKLKGWRAPLAELATQTSNVDFILAEDYELAAEFAFYWPRRLPVYIMSGINRRMNQYDLWPGMEQQQGRNALIVQINDARFPQAVLDTFASCTTLPEIYARDARGEAYRTFHAVRCERYTHIALPKPATY